MSVYINKEKTKKTIALILDKMREEADPVLLAEYHSLFKKEVSLFHRSKVAAWLLMLSEQGNNPALTEKCAPRRPRTEGRSATETDTQRYLLTDEESKRLFFSVGRSRRVYPREIIGLIITKTGISREDIGAIRILDNYSFVQVRDTVAEQLIEMLNGLNFRGRTLVVNYAKSRKDEETAEDTPASDISSDDDMPLDESASYDDEDISSDEDAAFDSEQDQDHSEEKDI